ncbi:MAG: 50S ribosomal protein L16, partial [bacterium]
MLQPKRTKFRYSHRGRRKGKETRANTLAFGEMGIMAIEPGWLNAAQIEAARVVLTRTLGRGGRVWLRVFPDKPVSKKPAETRMGKGKGELSHWVAVVRPGRILFEAAGVPRDKMVSDMAQAAQKISVKCKVVSW